MRIELGAGVVEGRVADGIPSFLGIPYATAARFDEPRPARWTGVLDGTRFGPMAPQPPGEPFLRDDLDQSEDCLRLNVWTPSTAGRRPVMVWLHGGGYRQGAPSSPLYDGAELARRGDVVVVGVGYRLGALGFCSHPELARADGTSGNQGLLDQIEALRWVRREITAFGGDPGRVTVFGQSAGGGSVTWLMLAPGARGLFHRAIGQSAVPAVAGAPAKLAGAAEELARRLHTDVAGLRRVPGERLLAAQLDVERTSGERLTFLPTAEPPIGEHIPVEGFRLGGAAPVPLLLGTNTDEWRLYAAADRHRRDLTAPQLLRRVERLVGPAASGVIDAYRNERAARGAGVAPNELWFAVQSDHHFRVPVRAVLDAHARHHPTFAYLFDWKSPGMGGFLGACHALEIPFVFGTNDRPGVGAWTGYGPAARCLAERMTDAWARFAWTGSPSTDELPWPAYDPRGKATAWFDAEPHIRHAPAETEVALLEAAIAALPAHDRASRPPTT